MENKKQYRNMLIDLRDASDNIIAEWNGKDDGLAEENAHIAEDIIRHVDELIELIDELN